MSNRYEKAKTRIEKVDTVFQVYSIVSNQGGRFLMHDEKSDSWLKMDETEARKKIAQSLRDFKKKRTKNSVCAPAATSTENHQHSRTNMMMSSSPLLLDEDLTSMAFDHVATNMRSNLTTRSSTSSPTTLPDHLVLHVLRHRRIRRQTAFMTIFKQQGLRNESITSAPIKSMHRHHHHLNQTPQLSSSPRKSSDRKSEDDRRPAVLVLSLETGEPLEFGPFEPLPTIGARVPMLRRHSLECDCCDYSFEKEMVGAVAEEQEEENMILS